MPNPIITRKLLATARAIDDFPGPPPDWRLDANQIVGVDGGAVATWLDVSGHGRDFTQATPANRPLLKLGIRNGKSCLRFDSGNDNMTCATMPSSQTFTIFVVSQTNPAFNQTSFHWGTTSNGFIVICIPPFRSTQVRNGGGTTTQTDGVYPTNTVEIQTYRRNNTGPLLELFINGVSTAISSNTAAMGLPGTNAVVGAFDPAAPSIFWGGDIFEIIGYAYLLTDAERAGVELYLKNKYNLP